MKSSLPDIIATIGPALIALVGTALLYLQNRGQMSANRKTEEERNRIRASEIASEREGRRLELGKAEWIRRGQIYSQFVSQAHRALLAIRANAGTRDEGYVDEGVTDDLTSAVAQVSVAGGELQSIVARFMGEYAAQLDRRGGGAPASGTPLEDAVNYLGGLLFEFEQEAAADLSRREPKLPVVTEAAGQTSSGPTRLLKDQRSADE